jgi:hypothetical protein
MSDFFNSGNWGALLILVCFLIYAIYDVLSKILTQLNTITRMIDNSVARLTS